MKPLFLLALRRWGAHVVRRLAAASGPYALHEHPAVRHVSFLSRFVFEIEMFTRAAAALLSTRTRSSSRMRGDKHVTTQSSFIKNSYSYNLASLVNIAWVWSKLAPSALPSASTRARPLS
mgnify:CR=1 FL=1